MYAPAYGFGPGSSSSPFNPNGAPPPPHNLNPHHNQQQQQQQQHMMYKPQQYGVGGHQSPYAVPGPAMGGNAGAMGMMQNNGMAHMGAGHGKLHTVCFSDFAQEPFNLRHATCICLADAVNICARAARGREAPSRVPQQ